MKITLDSVKREGVDHYGRTSISLKAKGLLLTVFSMGKEINDLYNGNLFELLDSELGYGKTIVYSCINELIDSGHVVRSVVRGFKGVSHYQYDFHEYSVL